MTIGAKSVFVATDNDPMLNVLQAMFQEVCFLLMSKNVNLK